VECGTSSMGQSYQHWFLTPGVYYLVIHTRPYEFSKSNTSFTYSQLTFILQDRLNYCTNMGNNPIAIVISSEHNNSL